jgi:hypothetical protein
VTFSDALTTAGPLRSGYIEVLLDYTTGKESGIGTGSTGSDLFDGAGVNFDLTYQFVDSSAHTEASRFRLKKMNATIMPEVSVFERNGLEQRCFRRGRVGSRLSHPLPHVTCLGLWVGHTLLSITKRRGQHDTAIASGTREDPVALQGIHFGEGFFGRNASLIYSLVALTIQNSRAGRKLVVRHG